MTPSGHAGAAIVTAYVIERCVFKSEASPVTLGLAAVASLLPDLDSLIVLARRRKRFLERKLCHHRYLTHTPLFYLALTLLVWLAGAPHAAALLGVLTFEHLLLDSWATDDGIMWLWPLSRRQFSLFRRDLHSGGAYGRRFYRRHVRCWPIMVPEVALLLSGSVLALYAIALS